MQKFQSQGFSDWKRLCMQLDVPDAEVEDPRHMAQVLQKWQNRLAMDQLAGAFSQMGLPDMTLCLSAAGLCKQTYFSLIIFLQGMLLQGMFLQGMFLQDMLLRVVKSLSRSLVSVQMCST